MSYCRRDFDSDVHVVRGAEGELACLECSASGSRGEFYCFTIPVMLGHLQVHRAAGQRVPERAVERLNRELLEQRAGREET